MSGQADRLREAARVLRERAEAATSGPWTDCPMGSEGSIVRAGGNTITTARKPATCREFADATYIATTHPGVGLALATWLDRYARHIDEAFVARTWVPAELSDAALAVAEAILGGAA